MEIRCSEEMRLSNAEKAVIDYINAQQGVLELFSIGDVARGAYVSLATVSRAIRKCGFASFSEMKFRLSEEQKGDKQSAEMNKILLKSYSECLETIKRIDISATIDIASRMRRARTVYLLANGLTALVANEFAIQLQCQKIPVCQISDSEMMRKMDLLASAGDLVLILSVKNSTPELAIGARLAKKMGAEVVLCCCTQGTVLDELADVAVYGCSQSIATNRIFGGTSRIGLQIITRTIVEYLNSGLSQ